MIIIILVLLVLVASIFYPNIFTILGRAIKSMHG